MYNDATHHVAFPPVAVAASERQYSDIKTATVDNRSMSAQRSDLSTRCLFISVFQLRLRSVVTPTYVTSRESVTVSMTKLSQMRGILVNLQKYNENSMQAILYLP